MVNILDIRFLLHPLQNLALTVNLQKFPLLDVDSLENLLIYQINLGGCPLLPLRGLGLDLGISRLTEGYSSGVLVVSL